MMIAPLDILNQANVAYSASSNIATAVSSNVSFFRVGRLDGKPCVTIVKSQFLSTTVKVMQPVPSRSGNMWKLRRVRASIYILSKNFDF